VRYHAVQSCPTRGRRGMNSLDRGGEPVEPESAVEVACDVCGECFVVPVAEQRFRRDRGLGPPTACPECRSRLREARNADLISLYDRASNPLAPEPAPARHSRNGHRGSRSHVTGQRYSTVCAACGAETQIPFVPRGDRPVYCRDCFNARRGR
jgi:CxxC-x17-CxxC domain-containing protein